LVGVAFFTGMGRQLEKGKRKRGEEKRRKEGEKRRSS
jgi:hypothetical protein